MAIYTRQFRHLAGKNISFMKKDQQMTQNKRNSINENIRLKINIKINLFKG